MSEACNKLQEMVRIEFGMRAAPGAIESVKIDPVTLESIYKGIRNDLSKRHLNLSRSWYTPVTSAHSR